MMKHKILGKYIKELKHLDKKKYSGYIVNLSDNKYTVVFIHICKNIQIQSIFCQVIGNICEVCSCCSAGPNHISG